NTATAAHASTVLTNGAVTAPPSAGSQDMPPTPRPSRPAIANAPEISSRKVPVLYTILPVTRRTSRVPTPAAKWARSTTSNGATTNPMTSGISVKEMVHEMPLRTSTLIASCSASSKLSASSGPIHHNDTEYSSGSHMATPTVATTPRNTTTPV